MELNDAHKNQISKFVAFFRGKRERIVADKEAGRAEFKADRLADDAAIFNKADVEALLDEYASQVIGAFKEEMEKMATNSADFCTQLLAEAEQKGATLDAADVSLVDDPSRAAQVLALAAGGGLGAAPGAKKTLGAIEGTSDPSALAAIAEAKEENRKKDDTIMSLQTQITGILQERSRLTGELEQVKENFKKMRSQGGGGGGDGGANLALQATLDAKVAELESVQKDMQKKLAESTQFRDLQAMMKKRTDEVKEMRRVITQAGLKPPGTADEGVELEADSD